MKRKLLFFIPLYVMLLMTFTRVEAAGTTTIQEMPTVTEKGQYVMLRHSISENLQNIKFQYNSGNNLQLVGFIPESGVNCNYTGAKEIECTSTGGLPTGAILTSVFRINNTFTTNQTITTSFIGTGTSTTTTTITGIARKIEVTSIGINKEEVELEAGDSFQLEATITPDNATDKKVTYTSNDVEVATINETGQITAVKEGETTVVVTSGNIKVNVKVKVKPKTVELEELKTDTKMTLKVGENKKLDIELQPDDTTALESDITYSSSDDKIATIDYRGRVVGIADGTAKITISLGDVSTTVEVTVTGEKEQKTKSGGSITSYIVTIAISVILTLVTIFIIKTIRNKKELDDDDDRDNNNKNDYDDSQAYNTYI